MSTFVKPSTEYKRTYKADYGREKIQILYEDQWIVVINKPTGLLSVPYPGSKVRTAQSVLEEILREKGIINSKHKPYVVHRLDRDTSGVMMFALTEQAQKIIMDSWHTMVSERLYIALAENPKKSTDLKDEGLIDDPLARNAHNVGFVPKQGDIDKNGRKFEIVAARTNYKMIQKGQTHTLFLLSLDTGKKNQIRAHLSFHGYPLCGDEEHRANTDPFHRLCLHAKTLEFVHPFTKEKLKFEVPEPEEWTAYVQKGDKNPEKPLWKKTDGSNRKNHSEQDFNNRDVLKLGERKFTRKAAAHMNFIEQGKKRRRDKKVKRARGYVIR